MFKWTCPHCGFIASTPDQHQQHVCAQPPNSLAQVRAWCLAQMANRGAEREYAAASDLDQVATWLAALDAHPETLNAPQLHETKVWAANDGLWTTQETVEANLRNFARTVLALSEPVAVPAASDLDQVAKRLAAHHLGPLDDETMTPREKAAFNMGVVSAQAHLSQRLPPGSRYATDEEARAAGERVIEKHRASLERLAKYDTSSAPPRCAHGVVQEGAPICFDCTSTTPENRISVEDRLWRWIQWWQGVMQPEGVGSTDENMRRNLARRFIRPGGAQG